MNRVELGLAVGAGYVLGRTRKLKLAIAVGTLVAGKRMNLGPRALADLVSGQLRSNPQFKEIGDQLREDLRGVGEAASGVMIGRRLDALADRLHGRTSEVRHRLAGVVPGTADGGGGGDEEQPEERAEPGAAEEEPPRKEAAKKTAAKTARKATKAPAKNTPAKKTAAQQSPAKKTAAKKTATRKTTSGTRTAARKATSAKSAARASRPAEGGGER